MSNTTPGEIKIPKTIIYAITAMGIITLISALLLLIGDFEAKGWKVFGTLVLFALFSGVTFWDSRKPNGVADSYKATIPLVMNCYLLGLGLIPVWGDSLFGKRNNDYYYYDSEFGFFLIISIFLVGRIAVAISSFLSKPSIVNNKQISHFASFASVISLLAGVLFTIPIALTNHYDMPEWYWKIAIGSLIGLGFAVSSIALLDSWIRSQNPKKLPWPTDQQGYPLPSLPNGQPDFRFLNGPAQATAPTGYDNRSSEGEAFQSPVNIDKEN